MRSVVPSAMVTSTPVSSMPVTRAPIRSSTPRPSSSLVARPARLSPNVANGSLPPSRRSTRTDAGSNVRKFLPRLRVASSRIWPASSQPVGPAPTMAIVSHCARSASSAAVSAISNAPSTRRRISNASSMVFIPGACSASSSWPKYDWPAPPATIRLS